MGQCSVVRSSKYNAPVNYIFDMSIHEYDISKANISILYDHGIINRDVYEELDMTPKSVREWRVGCMQRDDSRITEALNNGFMEARVAFAEKLGLSNEQILHVDKDAIFYVTGFRQANPPPSIMVGSTTHFTKRGTYNTFMKLGPDLYTYFWSNDGFINDVPSLKVRGMDSTAVDLHAGYFLSMLGDIVTKQRGVDSTAAYQVCKDCARKLYEIPTKSPNLYPYLRRFDPFGMYDIKDISRWSSFQATYVSEGMISMIDPSYNIGILELIGNYLMDDMLRSYKNK